VFLYVYPTIVAGKRLCKNGTAATNTHSIEDLYDASFSMQSVSYHGKYFLRELVVFSFASTSRDGREWPSGKALDLHSGGDRFESSPGHQLVY
jgi:hypothetical protein